MEMEMEITHSIDGERTLDRGEAAMPVERGGTPQPPNSLDDFLKVSEATAATTEHLAASIDRTRKPYAHRKAAMLRSNQAKLDTLLGKLMRLQNGGNGEAGLEERWKEGEVVMQSQSIVEGEVAASGAPDYRDIALQLYERGREHEHELELDYVYEHEQTVTRGTKMTSAPDYHTPPASDNNDEPVDSPSTLIDPAQHTREAAHEAQQLMTTNTEAKWLALAAQDLAFISRLVIAKQMLEVEEPEVAAAVKAFALKYSGAAAWEDRVAYYEDYEPPTKGSLGYAKAHLEDAADMLVVFSAEVANELRQISEF